MLKELLNKPRPFHGSIYPVTCQPQGTCHVTVLGVMSPLSSGLLLLCSAPTLSDSKNSSTQAPLSSTISWSLLKFMSIESMMLANHLILYCPLFLLPSIFPSIMVFSNEWSLHTECQKSRWGPLACPLIPHNSGPVSLLKCRECFVKHLASPTCLFVILSSGPDQGKSHSAGKFTAS